MSQEMGVKLISNPGRWTAVQFCCWGLPGAYVVAGCLSSLWWQGFLRSFALLEFFRVFSRPHAVSVTYSKSDDTGHL